MSKSHSITQNLVNEFFDCSTSDVLWKKKTGIAAKQKIGQIAGTVSNKGYRNIKFFGKMYLAHRLMFLSHHGYLPELIDHIDGNPLNNHISNLREASKSQNCCNSKMSKANTSGHKGVYKYKNNTWVVKVGFNSKSIHIGYFKNYDDACLASEQAREKYHKDFKRIS